MPAVAARDPVRLCDGSDHFACARERGLLAEIVEIDGKKLRKEWDESKQKFIFKILSEETGDVLSVQYFSVVLPMMCMRNRSSSVCRKLRWTAASVRRC